MCSNWFKTSSNVFNSVQSCSILVQLCSNVFKLVQMCLNVFKCVQICSNVFKLVQMCSNLFKTCSNVFKWVQMGPNLFKSCSNLFKSVQNLTEKRSSVKRYTHIHNTLKDNSGETHPRSKYKKKNAHSTCH